MLRWNANFESGHASIDAQHRTLILFINRLERLTKNTNPTPDEGEATVGFIDFLENYILRHLQEEENKLVQLRCPTGAAGKRVENEFTEFYREFKQRFAIEGYRPHIVKELSGACASWLEDHIASVEARLKLCRTKLPEPMNAN